MTRNVHKLLGAISLGPRQASIEAVALALHHLQYQVQDIPGWVSCQHALLSFVHKSDPITCQQQFLFVNGSVHLMALTTVYRT